MSAWTASPQIDEGAVSPSSVLVAAAAKSVRPAAPLRPQHDGPRSGGAFVKPDPVARPGGGGGVRGSLLIGRRVLALEPHAQLQLAHGVLHRQLPARAGRRRNGGERQPDRVDSLPIQVGMEDLGGRTGRLGVELVDRRPPALRIDALDEGEPVYVGKQQVFAQNRRRLVELVGLGPRPGGKNGRTQVQRRHVSGSPLVHRERGIALGQCRVRQIAVALVDRVDRELAEAEVLVLKRMSELMGEGQLLLGADRARLRKQVELLRIGVVEADRLTRCQIELELLERGTRGKQAHVSEEPALSGERGVIDAGFGGLRDPVANALLIEQHGRDCELGHQLAEVLHLRFDLSVGGLVGGGIRGRERGARKLRRRRRGWRADAGLWRRGSRRGGCDRARSAGCGNHRDDQQ